MDTHTEEVVLESACNRPRRSATFHLARQQDAWQSILPQMRHSSLMPIHRPGCRTDFEALAGDFFTSAAKPLRTILERNGLLKGGSGVDIKAVELLGGGSRVPAVQAALSKALGGRALDK